MYTQVQVESMVGLYQLQTNDVERKQAVKHIAADFNRSERSVISKLVAEKVYVKPDSPSANPKDTTSKEAYVTAIEIFLSAVPGELKSFNNTSKVTLKRAVELLTQLSDKNG